MNLVQTNTSPVRQEITDALSGNLCRCTGYAPIIDATAKACEKKSALKVDDSADLPLAPTAAANVCTQAVISPEDAASTFRSPWATTAASSMRARVREVSGV